MKAVHRKDPDKRTYGYPQRYPMRVVMFFKRFYQGGQYLFKTFLGHEQSTLFDLDHPKSGAAFGHIRRGRFRPEE